MKNWYIVSFEYSEGVFCSNLCYADTKEQVEDHYKEYVWSIVRTVADWEIDSYKDRGMPVITLGGENGHE